MAPDIRSPAYLADRRRDLELSIDAGIAGALGAGKADVLLAPMSAAAKCTGKAGAPVIAIPAGLDADGLPFGVTVFAAPGQDARVLQAALLVERIAGERIAPVLA
ncbi:amidase family protein [Massilia brevitalea]|uniref:amidase family protein n=1 Tax=Massilia brevitalea TaxID=442526 RepID=UPI00273A2D90|nr:amidase family protein [Massilia brevitalea]